MKRLSGLAVAWFLRWKRFSPGDPIELSQKFLQQNDRLISAESYQQLLL